MIFCFPSPIYLWERVVGFADRVRARFWGSPFACILPEVAICGVLRAQPVAHPHQLLLSVG